MRHYSLLLLILLLPMLGHASRPVAARDMLGSYFAGDGLGYGGTLTMKADGTFSGGASTDTAPSVLFDASGTFRVRHNRLLLQATQGKSESDFKWKGQHVFQIIPWGARLYLVEPSDLLRFCNDVNLGIEPRGRREGGYYLREGDSDKPVSGHPQLPLPWAGYLFSHPINGRVLALQPMEKPGLTTSAKTISITINVGRRQGLKPGMRLWMDKEVTFAEVVQVKEAQSIAQAEHSSHPIAVGSPVSSQLPARLRMVWQKIVPRGDTGSAGGGAIP